MNNMTSEQICNEVSNEIEQGKGCIIFDFGLFFPYKTRENEELVFRFKLGEEELPEQKLNHRYNNKGYYTITRKKGRGLYKCGYPYFFDYKEGEPNLSLLCINFGVIVDGKDETVELVFPLELYPTKEKPVFGLSFHLIYENGDFTFESCEKDADSIGWIPHLWSNRELSVPYTPLITAECDNENYNLVYVPSIKPIAQRPNELMIR